jgi:hypothetical protein
MKHADCFPMIVQSFSVDSPEDAWEAFYEECERHFEWIKGKKIWRSPPKLYLEKGFESDIDNYLVRARYIAVHELPEGMEEAVVRGPYPEQRDPFEGSDGFLLKYL